MEGEEVLSYRLLVLLENNLWTRDNINIYLISTRVNEKWFSV